MLNEWRSRKNNNKDMERNIKRLNIQNKPIKIIKNTQKLSNVETSKPEKNG